jgi:uncharacterized repeat protein (TIGR01451 family)
MDPRTTGSATRRIARPILAALAVAGLLGPLAALADPPGITEWVSVDSAETQANQDSVHAAMTPDGRFVAFASLASNLVPGDTNDLPDTFVRDRLTGTTERVSVDSHGREGDGASGVIGIRSLPSLSGDGRFVAFESNATNLVAGDTSPVRDIYVADRQAGTLERVSVNGNGVGGEDSSFEPAITSDGRFVAFESFASNLVPGDDATKDVFVHDRQTRATEKVSVNSAGMGGESDSELPALSDDGQVVAFESYSRNLVPGDTNSAKDVFVHDDRPAADLAVTTSDVPDPVRKGQNLTYTVVVTNNGPAQATGVTLTDSLPADVSFVSATTTAGSCAAVSGTITCDLGVINTGASATVTIVVKPKKVGTISNTARVSSS